MPRWPFVLADAVLLAAATALVLNGNRPLALHEVIAVAALCALGAWIMILPFLRDHAAAVKLQEQAGLADTARQIGDLQSVAAHIREATAQWQSIHEGARKASETATGAVERVGAEAKAFTDFLARTNDQEKQAMRLELEKLRRGGTEHLQVIVHVLDHVHALYQASARNGATPLTTQLGQFRGACLDAVRRIGLASYEAKPGDAFDANVHQTPEGREPAPGARITSTVACGYTYQGQPVRRILVTVESPEADSGAPGGAPEGASRIIREVEDDPALELPLGEDPDSVS